MDPAIIPHWAPPTHALQIFRYAEQLSIRMLWIQCTNPAVSLPDLARIRRILANPDLFVIVNEMFPTETTDLADVVLPAAAWGEKTGTFTNVDRTVHIAYTAVEPPGEARSDFEIFRRLRPPHGFPGRDGAPLVKWRDPEAAFEAWKACSAGRPCDYTGLSYAKLTGGSGIPWPCDAENPNGKPRIYEDGVFPTSLEVCETYGHDLTPTGAEVTPEEYKTKDPRGKAFLKPAEYQPPHEEPDEDYPFWFSTGRLAYHFHTRTKTGRSRSWPRLLPEAYAQMNAEDAASLGVSEGDSVAHHLAPRRDRGAGASWRHGAWADSSCRFTMATGMIRSVHVPPMSSRSSSGTKVSKQPHYKYAAVKIGRIDRPATDQPEGETAKAPRAPRPCQAGRGDRRGADDTAAPACAGVPPPAGGRRADARPCPRASERRRIVPTPTSTTNAACRPPGRSGT